MKNKLIKKNCICILLAVSLICSTNSYPVLASGTEEVTEIQSNADVQEKSDDVPDTEELQKMSDDLSGTEELKEKSDDLPGTEEIKEKSDDHPGTKELQEMSTKEQNTSNKNGLAVMTNDDTAWTDNLSEQPEGFTEDENQIIISSPEGLAWLSVLVNGLNGQTATNFAEKTIILGTDIDLAGKQWTPIGSKNSIVFSGTFDGQGYSILNMTINAREQNIGFFGYSNGTIQNLIMKNPVIVSEGSAVGAIAGRSEGDVIRCGVEGGSITGVNNVAGIAGVSTTGNRLATVSGCYNLNSAITATNGNAAGVVCYFGGNVVSCYNTGKITATRGAGGVVCEWITGSGQGIQSCLAYLDTSTTAYTSYGTRYTEDQFTKGEVARALNYMGNNSTPSYDYWGQDIGTDTVPVLDGPQVQKVSYYKLEEGTVNKAVSATVFINVPTYDTEKNAYIIENIYDWLAFVAIVKGGEYDANAEVVEGAIIDFSTLGTMTYNITDEYNITIAYNSDSSKYYTGTFNGNGCIVTGLQYSTTISYAGYSLFGYLGANAKISGITLEAPQISAGSNTAGFVKSVLSGAEVSDCHLVGGSIQVTGNGAAGGIAAINGGLIKDCTNSAAIQGVNFAGGIAATYSQSATTTNPMKIESCDNTGNIMSTGASSARVGGIFGGHDGRFYSVPAFIDIVNCDNTGSIDGGSYVGGIVGYIFAYGSQSNVNINNCWNTGDIKGTSFLGGIIGHAYTTTSQITNCYNTGNVGTESSTTNIAGISGYSGKVTYCYNVGIITGTVYAQPLVAYSKDSRGTYENDYALEDCVKGYSGNLYYGGDPNKKTEGRRSEEQFRSGQVAYELNGDQSTITWYQTTGEGLPVFEGEQVYRYERKDCQGNSQKPISCGYSNDPNHEDTMEHLLTHTDAKDASCTQSGNLEYWSCKSCSKFFSDKDGITEVSKSDINIAALGHTYQTPVFEWIVNSNGGYNAKAKRICLRDVSHTLEVTAKVTAQITEATADNAGQIVYTATAVFAGDSTNYTDTKTTVLKRLNTISSVNDKITKNYTGEEICLSEANGTDIKWNGSGTGTISGYYIDAAGKVKTSTTDQSGAFSEGGAPANAGIYYAKIEVTEDSVYAEGTALIPFEIKKTSFEILQDRIKEANSLLTSGKIYTTSSLNQLTDGIRLAGTYKAEDEEVVIKEAVIALSAKIDALKEAEVEVKLQSDPINAGILSGGGYYEKNKNIILKAVAVDGFEFQGWYKGDDFVTKEPSFTVSTGAAIAMGDNSLIYTAKYNANETKKLTLNVGNGKVGYSYNNDQIKGIWINNFDNQTYAKGTFITVTAMPNANYTFLYWIDARTGRILSEDLQYSFYVSEDMKLEASYKSTPAEEPASHYVIFKDMSGHILSARDVEDGKEANAPSHGTFTGYTFIGWDKSFDNVKEDMIITAKYTKNSGYKIEITGGTVNNSKESYTYGDLVSVSAKESSEGKYFSGWYKGNILVSDKLEYSFYITENTDLTAQYNGSEVIKEIPRVLMDMSSRENLENGYQKVQMNVTWSVTEGYSFMEAGIVRTLDDAQNNNLTLDKVDGNAIKKNTTKITIENGTYAYTLTLSTASTTKNLFAKGYMIYKNISTGEVFTVYTDLNTSNAVNK